MDNSEDKIRELELEKQRMQDEFNVQRAKLKDLYLQREEELTKLTEKNTELSTLNEKLQKELDDMKSQILINGMTLENDYEQEKRKADEEIASLRHLFNEVIEESSSSRTIYENNLKKLHDYIKQLQKENITLKHTIHESNQESTSLAPSLVLNALTKGIVKKLGADSQSDERKQEQTQAQEDTELTNSLIGPLEDQIKALKEKLRSTDEKLQNCQECHQLNINNSIQCDMCSNYEAQLVQEQKKSNNLEFKLRANEMAIEKHKMDLLKEIGFRKDMEEKWNEKREEHKQQVIKLKCDVECVEQDLKELQQLFRENQQDIQGVLKKLSEDREKISQELIALQNDNDNLIGKYLLHSQEFENLIINLPNNIEELHELLLKNYDELILTKIGKESIENELLTNKSEKIIEKQQYDYEKSEWLIEKNLLINDINLLKKQLKQMDDDKLLYINTQKYYNDLQIKFNDLNQGKEHLQMQVKELENRLTFLQQELDNSEDVQKDFVRLSQNLQVQLEKIRESDLEVRWKHPEDFHNCTNCQQKFLTNKQKEHCKHCGQIFCLNCLGHTVNSGPNMLPSSVCDVCYTLLVKSAAPYFSETTPPTTSSSTPTTNT